MVESNGHVEGGMIITESERVQKREEVTRENTKRSVEMKINSAFDGLENIVAYFLSEEKRFPNKYEAVALHHQMKEFLGKLPINGVDYDGKLDHISRFFINFFKTDDEVKEFKTGKIFYIPIIDDMGVQNEAGFELIVNKKLQFQIMPIKDANGKVDVLAQEVENRDIGD